MKITTFIGTLLSELDYKTFNEDHLLLDGNFNFKFSKQSL